MNLLTTLYQGMTSAKYCTATYFAHNYHSQIHQMGDQNVYENSSSDLTCHRKEKK